jgi:hypothetical protein
MVKLATSTLASVISLILIRIGTRHIADFSNTGADAIRNFILMFGSNCYQTTHLINLDD